MLKRIEALKKGLDKHKKILRNYRYPSIKYKNAEKIINDIEVTINILKKKQMEKVLYDNFS